MKLLNGNFQLLKQYDSEGQGMNGKPMDVCSVCACFSVQARTVHSSTNNLMFKAQGEAANRVQDHLTGKLHMGYLRIKNTLEELEVRCALFNSTTISSFQEQKKERREKEEKEREERRKRRDEEERERKEKRAKRSRSRSRDRRRK